MITAKEAREKSLAAWVRKHSDLKYRAFLAYIDNEIMKSVSEGNSRAFFCFGLEKSFVPPNFNMYLEDRFRLSIGEIQGVMHGLTLMGFDVEQTETHGEDESCGKERIVYSFYVYWGRGRYTRNVQYYTDLHDELAELKELIRQKLK